MKYIAVALICLSMTACSEVESEQQTTFTYLGTTYPASIKTFSQNGRTFEKMFIRVGAQRVSCIPNDRRDCGAAIENLKENRVGVL